MGAKLARSLLSAEKHRCPVEVEAQLSPKTDVLIAHQHGLEPPLLGGGDCTALEHWRTAQDLCNLHNSIRIDHDLDNHLAFDMCRSRDRRAVREKVVHGKGADF